MERKLRFIILWIFFFKRLHQLSYIVWIFKQLQLCTVSLCNLKIDEDNYGLWTAMNIYYYNTYYVFEHNRMSNSHGSWHWIYDLRFTWIFSFMIVVIWSNKRLHVSRHCIRLFGKMENHRINNGKCHQLSSVRLVSSSQRLWLNIYSKHK